MENPIARTPSSFAYPLLVGRILESGVRKAPRQTIRYADRTMTYGDLHQRVNRLAGGLSALGVAPGRTVAVMDWDSSRYLECFFAIPMMGAVLHMVNIRLSADQILYTVNHAADDVILVHRDFLPILEQIWDRIENPPRLVLMRDDREPADTRLPIATDYEALLGAAAAGYRFPDLDEDTRATTFYTTGTTGLPKGVYFSHRQLTVHTLSVSGEFQGTGQGRFNADDVYMPITPMFHVHAWGFPYVATLNGCRQVYPGRLSADTLVDLIEKEKVTFSHCVPTILRAILSNPRSAEVDLRRWKVIIGGSALPQALAKEALARGIDVFTAYGMSETCPLLTVAHLPEGWEAWSAERQIEVRCMTGRPLRMVDMRIVDEEMRDVARDGVTPGEIVVRAPWVTQGYLRDPENSERLWSGGWMHTGDIAVMDADGYVKIVDRLKDVIKTGGEWVSSIDLEDLILKAPGVADAAVISVPDPKWVERPLAVVVARSAGLVTEESLKAHLRALAEDGLMSRFAVPDRIVFVDELPRTSVGKVNKKALRELHSS